MVAQLVAMVEAQTAAVENMGAEWVRNVQSEGTDQIVAVQTAGEESKTAAMAEIEAKGKNVRESIPEDYTALSEAVATLAPGIVCEAEGTAITLSDSSSQRLQGMRIFGKSTQDGVPSPEAPVEIVSVDNPTVSVNDQTLSIPRTLPGIPVTSGGNYTDATGQQWVCDEVDLGRGVYVRRVGVIESYTSEEITGEFLSTTGELTTSATVIYALTTPIETPLSETEIAAYRALHTNKPNTTIINDSGAHMAVEYVADTKLYIDNLVRRI